MGKESESARNSTSDGQIEEQPTLKGSVNSETESKESADVREKETPIVEQPEQSIEMETVRNSVDKEIVEAPEIDQTDVVEEKDPNIVGNNVAVTVTDVNEGSGESNGPSEFVEERKSDTDGEDVASSIAMSSDDSITAVSGAAGEGDIDDGNLTTYRSRKRVLTGNVVSDKANQTIVVSISRRKKHRLYKKYITRTKKVKAHDPGNECRIGDLVAVVESRPLSKEKRWRLIKIVKRSDQ